MSKDMETPKPIIEADSKKCRKTLKEIEKSFKSSNSCENSFSKQNSTPETKLQEEIGTKIDDLQVITEITELTNKNNVNKLTKSKSEMQESQVIGEVPSIQEVGDENIGNILNEQKSLEDIKNFKETALDSFDLNNLEINQNQNKIGEEKINIGKEKYEIGEGKTKIGEGKTKIVEECKSEQQINNVPCIHKNPNEQKRVDLSENGKKEKVPNLEKNNMLLKILNLFKSLWKLVCGPFAKSTLAERKANKSKGEECNTQKTNDETSNQQRLQMDISNIKTDFQNEQNQNCNALDLKRQKDEKQSGTPPNNGNEEKRCSKPLNPETEKQKTFISEDDEQGSKNFKASVSKKNIQEIEANEQEKQNYEKSVLEENQQENQNKETSISKENKQEIENCAASTSEKEKQKTQSCAMSVLEENKQGKQIYETSIQNKLELEISVSQEKHQTPNIKARASESNKTQKQNNNSFVSDENASTPIEDKIQEFPVNSKDTKQKFKEITQSSKNQTKEVKRSVSKHKKGKAPLPPQVLKDGKKSDVNTEYMNDSLKKLDDIITKLESHSNELHSCVWDSNDYYDLNDMLFELTKRVDKIHANGIDAIRSKKKETLKKIQKWETIMDEKQSSD